MQNPIRSQADILHSQAASQVARMLLVLLKRLLIGVGVGLVVGAVGSLFGHTLSFANTFRLEHPWVLYFLPVGGLVIVFLYRFFKNADDRGTNTIIASIQESTEVPFKMAPLIFISTTITHLCGGSAGREGAAIQLGGSIARHLARALRLNDKDRRTLILCGMSAGFSALFGTPMAAAVFSLEVITVGVMQYAALAPCVASALVAHFVAEFFHMPPEVFPVAAVPAFTGVSLGQTAILAAAVGGVGLLFCVVLHRAEHLYEKYMKNQYVRIAAAGCIVIVLSLLLGDRYLGSGMAIIEDVFHTGSTPWYTFLLKMVFTAATLGAGFKGGEIVPSFTIGASLGCAMAGIMGLPPELAAACGMAGLFCAVTNCPITSLLIAFELFGFAGMPYYLVTVAVSYMFSGFQGLYKQQKFFYSETLY